MNWIAEDAVSLLMFLAPGLVAVGIFVHLLHIHLQACLIKSFKR